jgi:CDP-glycerol glycerophosphotransferase (TagB/SpsB family)
MKRRSQEEWQVLILRQTESGLSAQQFCRDNDICPKYFSLRKKQLGLRQSAFVPVLQSKQVNPKTPVAAIKFASFILRHGACCLHFEEIPDSTWLAQLVRELA